MYNMGPTSWNVIKFVLAAGTPIQRLILGRGDTHTFCNHQALKILKKDGYNTCLKHLNNYFEFVNRGVLWADRGLKYFSHYFNPATNSGLGPWPDARLEFNNYFKKALVLWNRGNKKKAFFFLGASVHLVQDLCVPHHSKGIAFFGHQEYEKWVRDNFTFFSVHSNGAYNSFNDPDEWLTFNARISRDYLPYVSCLGSDTSYNMATGVLLPLAQRSTAGFFKFYFDCINKNIGNF